MRVGKTGSPKGASGNGAARRGGGNFQITSDAPTPASVSAPSSVAQPAGIGLAESLMAIEERRRAIERGKASLDCLDQLRLDILEGRISEATAARLAALAAETGGATLDPQLQEAVDEIGFRLRFETARLARGSRRRQKA